MFERDRFCVLAAAGLALSGWGGVDSAAWIGEPAEAESPRFLLFACPFDGRKEPLELDVSADQRYILLLDGEVVGRGPDNGDARHWYERHQTLNPGPGRHLLEAVVWSLGIAYANGRTDVSPLGNRPFAHQAVRTGFALKADGVYGDQLTTGVAPWKYAVLTGTRPIGSGAEGAAFGAGPQFEVRGASLLDERPAPAAFRPAAVISRGGGFDPSSAVRRGGVTPRGRRTVQSLLPEQLSRLVRPGEMPRKQVVPARTCWTKVFDLGDYYCGYPVVKVRGGRGARASWGWTEALRDPARLEDPASYGKANRARREGMVFSDKYALTDVFVCDGRSEARFTTPWWRCGRWCRLTVETQDEPLEIVDVALDESRYPAEDEGSFEAEGDASLAAIARLSVRGLQMCAHEIMFDCPFFEQQMYGGDVRVSFLGLTAMTRDDRLIRQGLRIFDFARDDEGYVPMNWPSANDQTSTTWLLSWIVAVGDFARWHADRDWLADRMPGIEHSLMGVARYENARGLLENARGWNYLDWVAEWKDDGCSPPGAAWGKGESAALNLLYLLAQQKAADAYEACGDAERAAAWRTRADRLAARIADVFRDGRQGLLADTPAKTSFSEHVQALAILTGVVRGADAERALAATEDGRPMARCSSFFLSYLFEACARTDRGDLVLRKLDVWRRYVENDLKCPLESEFFPRSDCHGFGAHPLFHFHACLAGVTPAAPFFERVRVAPSPGPLTAIRAKTPHPKGFVETSLSFEDGQASGTVALPPGVFGEFVWKGRSLPLVPGTNAIPASVRAPKIDGRWFFDNIGGKGAWLDLRDFERTGESRLLALGGSPEPMTAVRNADGSYTLTREWLYEGHPDWNVFRQLVFWPTEGDSMACTFAQCRGGLVPQFNPEKHVAKRIPPVGPPPQLNLLEYGVPVDLLKDGLDGWVLKEPGRKSCWVFHDGVLENTGTGANLLSKRRDFMDFKIVYDVRADKDCNSGVFLRGIYELQVSDSFGKPVDSHNMGALYGRIAPSVAAEKPAGEWQHVEAILCDRHITVTLNDVRVIDNRPIDGMTGSGITGNEFVPGPIFLQGDHKGGAYRNMILHPIRGKQ